VPITGVHDSFVSTFTLNPNQIEYQPLRTNFFNILVRARLIPQLQFSDAVRSSWDSVYQ